MPRDNRCMYMAHVCFMSVVVTGGLWERLVCSGHEFLLLFTTSCPSVSPSAFMICSGLCACTEMLWMYVLYVSFWYKVRPRTFGCVAMGSALLCIFRSRLLVYSAGSGVNRVQVVLN